MTTRTNATSQVYWAFAHRFWKCATCNNQWDSVLLSSRDGVDFSFVGNREPWVRPGPDGGAGSRMIHVMPTPIEVGDELFVYVAMTDENHAGAVDPASPGGKKQTAVVLFRLRKDGLVIPTQLRSRTHFIRISARIVLGTGLARRAALSGAVPGRPPRNADHQGGPAGRGEPDRARQRRVQRRRRDARGAHQRCHPRNRHRYAPTPTHDLDVLVLCLASQRHQSWSWGRLWLRHERTDGGGRAGRRAAVEDERLLARGD